jgi:RNA polymerase sigma-70 factor (ECF subfamily)
MARTQQDEQDWVRALGGAGAEHDQAVKDLHALLVRVARSELQRRSGQLHVSGPELDDLAHQAAADALLAVVAKLDSFRGESRFTTWAYKFVVFEVSSKVGRHFWRHPAVPMDKESWDLLPDRLGLEPSREAEWRDLLGALHRAVDSELTARQREVFVALVLNGVPVDAVVVELGTNRNAVYKTMFDARRKIRARLVANGHLQEVGE